MTVHYTDSVDKIVTTYFACVTEEEFEYKNHIFKPRPLMVSPSIIYGLRCVMNCGGCCLKFSLDYLPDEAYQFCQERTIEFNGKSIKVLSDMQKDNDTRWCRWLRMSEGRCTIHGQHPFTCSFETLRFKQFQDIGRFNLLGNYHFGRAWNFQRIDGGKGARCIITSRVTPRTIDETIFKLTQLKRWADHFGLKTKTEKIIDNINKSFLRRIRKPFII